MPGLPPQLAEQNLFLHAVSWAFVVLIGVMNKEKALGKLRGLVLEMHDTLQ